LPIVDSFRRLFCGDSILPEDLLWVFLYSVVQFDFTIYQKENLENTRKNGIS
jgi:hypothetical protein